MQIENRQTGRAPELHPSGSLNHLHGTFLGFPLASRSDLPGSQSICAMSRDPATHVQPSPGFYRKGVWVEHPLT